MATANVGAPQYHKPRALHHGGPTSAHGPFSCSGGGGDLRKACHSMPGSQHKQASWALNAYPPPGLIDWALEDKISGRGR